MRISILFFLLFTAPSLIFANENEIRKTPASSNHIEERLNGLQNEMYIQKQITQSSLDHVDKRLADFGALATMQGSHTAWVGNLVAFVSIGITILVFAAGFLTYLSTKARAIKEARNAVEEWFEKNASDLKNQITELRNEAISAQLLISELIDAVRKNAIEAHKFFNERKQKIDEAHEKFLHRPSYNPPQQNTHEGTEDKNSISFATLYQEGLKNYDAGKLPQALELFNSALELSDDAPLNILAGILVAKQFTLKGMERYEEIIALHKDILSRTSLSTDPDVRYTLAQSFLNKASAFSSLKRLEDELAAYDAVINRFENDESTDLQTAVARALLNKGVTLSTLGRPREEIEAYEVLIKKFKDTKNLKMRERLTRASLYKAITHGELNQYDEELNCYSYIIDNYLNDNDPEIRKNVARSLIQKALRLTLLKLHDESLQFYEIAEKKYEHETSDFFGEVLAKSLIGKAIALHHLKQYDKELIQYSVLESKFDINSASEETRKVLCNAMLLKSTTLTSQQKNEDAERTLHQILIKFGNDESNAIQETVKKARAMLEKGEQQPIAPDKP